MLWYHFTGVLHFGQKEEGDIKEIFRGRRYMHTFAKLPSVRPSKKENMLKKIFTFFIITANMGNLNSRVDVVVVGGGPAGYSCAIFCARKGKKTVLIEKNEVGGVCLNRGCIPSKTVISSLKKGVVTPQEIERRKKTVVNRLKNSVISHIVKAGVKLINGTAQFLKDKELRVGGARITANNVVIATGSLPKPSPFDSSCIVTSDVAINEWISSPPSRILIVGGGAIGCEFATIFKKMGSDVIIVEILKHILPSVDEDVASIVEREFRKKKVKVISGDKVVEMKGKRITLSSGEVLEVDGVLWATGRVPCIQDLNLESAGVKLENGWIKVDNSLRTANHSIYAIGDCNGLSLTAYAGYIQALVVAKNILGRKSVYDKDLIPYAVFSDPEVAWVGLTQRAAEENGIDVSAVSLLMRTIGRSQTDEEIGGVCKLVIDSAGILRGAQLVGAHVSEIIHYLALLIKKGVSIEELSHLHHIHPSFTEVIWETALKFTDFSLHGE